MKNVTISLPEDVAHWARVEAAKAGKSLSRWMADKLANEQTAAIERFLGRPAIIRVSDQEPLPTKDEIYAERLFDKKRTAI